MCCLVFFDTAGKSVKSSLDDRIIGLTMDQLKKVPQRIGIAESKEKVGSIHAALLGGILTTLVTTEETAKEILLLD
ncbi:sugar-binding domain-containing protein [uncultured Enterococcus sp.]|uniref:sugar-binding domain-containing protein n=1 Tax=uncultured Enterococcus sp. TaxID=167972 RepID=UPI002AA7B2EF|nr:sugar-binding domain-containing protein [uncultured Enterococcus sp.]